MGTVLEALRGVFREPELEIEEQAPGQPAIKDRTVRQLDFEPDPSLDDSTRPSRSTLLSTVTAEAFFKNKPTAVISDHSSEPAAELVLSTNLESSWPAFDVAADRFATQISSRLAEWIKSRGGTVSPAHIQSHLDKLGLTKMCEALQRRFNCSVIAIVIEQLRAAFDKHQTGHLAFGEMNEAMLGLNTKLNLGAVELGDHELKGGQCNVEDFFTATFFPNEPFEQLSDEAFAAAKKAQDSKFKNAKARNLEHEAEFPALNETRKADASTVSKNKSKSKKKQAAVRLPSKAEGPPDVLAKPTLANESDELLLVSPPSKLQPDKTPPVEAESVPAWIVESNRIRREMDERAQAVQSVQDVGIATGKSDELLARAVEERREERAAAKALKKLKKLSKRDAAEVEKALREQPEREESDSKPAADVAAEAKGQGPVDDHPPLPEPELQKLELDLEQEITSPGPSARAARLRSGGASGGGAELALQIQIPIPMPSLSSPTVPDKASPSPKFLHNISVDNFQLEKLNMAETTVFVPVLAPPNTQVEAAVDIDAGNGLDIGAYTADIRSLQNCESMFSFDDYIGRLSEVLDSAVELSDFKKTVESDTLKARTQQTELRDGITRMILQATRERKLDPNLESMPLSDLLDSADKQMRLQKKLSLLQSQKQTAEIKRWIQATEQTHTDQETELATARIQLEQARESEAERLEDHDPVLVAVIADMPNDMIVENLRGRKLDISGQADALRYRLLEDLLLHKRKVGAEAAAHFENDMRLMEIAVDEKRNGAQLEAEIGAAAERGIQTLLLTCPKNVVRDLAVLFNIDKDSDGIDEGIGSMDLDHLHTRLLKAIQDRISKEMKELNLVDINLQDELGQTVAEADSATRRAERLQGAVFKHIKSMTRDNMELALAHFSSAKGEEKVELQELDKKRAEFQEKQALKLGTDIIALSEQTDEQLQNHLKKRCRNTKELQNLKKKELSTVQLVAAVTDALRQESKLHVDASLEKMRNQDVMDYLVDQLYHASLDHSLKQSQINKIREGSEGQSSTKFMAKFNEYQQAWRDAAKVKRRVAKLQEDFEQEAGRLESRREKSDQMQRKDLWASIEEEIDQRMEGEERLQVSISDWENRVLVRKVEALAANIKQREKLEQLVLELNDGRLMAVVSMMSIDQVQETMHQRRRASQACKFNPDATAISYELRIQLVEEHLRLPLSEAEIGAAEEQIAQDDADGQDAAEKIAVEKLLGSASILDRLKRNKSLNTKSNTKIAEEVSRLKTEWHTRRHLLLSAALPFEKGEELEAVNAEYAAAIAVQDQPTMVATARRLEDAVHERLRVSRDTAEPASIIASIYSAAVTAPGALVNNLFSSASDTRREASGDASEGCEEPAPEQEPELDGPDHPKTTAGEGNYSGMDALSQLSVLMELPDDAQRALSAMPIQQCQKHLRTYMSRVEKQKVETLMALRRCPHEPVQKSLVADRDAHVKMLKVLHDATVLGHPELRVAQKLYKKHMKTHQSSVAHLSTTEYIRILAEILQRPLSPDEQAKASEGLESEKTRLAGGITAGFANVRAARKTDLRVGVLMLVTRRVAHSRELRLARAFAQWRLTRIMKILDAGGETAQTKSASETTSNINAVARLRQLNEEVEVALVAQAQLAKEVKEVELAGYKLFCYRQLRDVLQSCRDAPSAQVIPPRAGRPLARVDLDLFQTLCDEVSTSGAVLHSSIDQLTDTTELVDIVLFMQSACQYSKPGHVINSAIDSMCAQLNRIVKNQADVQPFEIRRYLHVHYAMTKLQVDGLLLWMVTHMSDVQNEWYHKDGGYETLMDTAARLWSRELDMAYMDQNVFVRSHLSDSVCKGTLELAPRKAQDRSWADHVTTLDALCCIICREFVRDPHIQYVA